LPMVIRSIRASICTTAGMDADGNGDSTTPVELVADTLGGAGAV
jgi:hypothetical protein